MVVRWAVEPPRKEKNDSCSSERATQSIAAERLRDRG